MLRYLTAGESHGPALDRHRRRLSVGSHARHGTDRPRARAPAGRLRPGQAAEARNRPDHRRFGRLSRRHHGCTDHAAADQQRRQARAAGRAGLAARRAHRPGRRDQLPDRNPPGARARQCPRDGAAGRGRWRWPSCLLRELGDHGLRLRPRAGRHRRRAAVVRPGDSRRQPGLYANPAADAGDRRRDRRRARPATRWAGSSRPS